MARKDVINTDGSIKWDAIGSFTEQLAETVNDAISKALNAKIPFGTSLVPAKGDGVTDDSPALQGIINYLSSIGGGTIYLPKGVYILKSELKWKSNVSLIGAGVGLSILKPYDISGLTQGFAAIGWVMGSTSDVNPMVNCVFRNFEIDGIDMTISSYTHKPKGFYIQFMKDCIFKDLFIQNTGATGLGIDFLHKVDIDNVNTKNCGRLWTDDGNWGGPGGAGIGIGTGGMADENYFITNCTADGNGHYGIFVEDQVVFGHTPSYLPKGSTITNCIVKNGRWDGIGVKGGSHLIIANNIVYNNLHSGVAISHQASNVLIDANILTDNAFGNITLYNSPPMVDIKITPSNSMQLKNGRLTLDKLSFQYVKLPAETGEIAGVTPFTIHTKFKLIENNDKTIISKMNTAYSSTGMPRGWALRTASDGKLKIEAYLTDNGIQIYRKGTTILQTYILYYVKLVYNGTTFSLYLSTDGVNYTQETISDTVGTDADLRACFSYNGNVDSPIGRMWLGSNGYGYYFYGYLYFLKIWKGTNDISTKPTIDYSFMNFGINQPVIDTSTGYNGQAWNGAEQNIYSFT